MTGIPTGNPTMLSDDAYAAATDHLSKFTVTGTTITADAAVASVSITQAGKSYEQDLTLSLVRRDLGIFDVWRVDGSNLPNVYISYARPDGMGLTVNGVDFGVIVGSYQYDVPAFPATWEFAPEGGTDFYDAAPVSVTTRFEGEGASTTAALPVTLTDAGVASANAAMSAQLDACMAQATMNPGPGCGFGLTDDGQFTNAVYSNVVWTLDQRPTVTFGDWRTNFGWAVVPGTPGSLSATAEFTADEGDGDASGTVPDFMQHGTITTIDDAGVATFVSDYQ
jgi:hypothetical protein